MTDESVRQILEALDKLSVKLGTTGEHLWQVLVKQAPIWAISDIIGCAICLTFIVCILLYCKNGAKEAISNESCEYKHLMCAVISGTCILVGVVFGASFLVHLPLYVAAFNNPEYLAFKEICNFIK